MLVNEIIIAKIKKLLDSAIKSKSKTKFVYKKILDEFTKIDVPIISKTQIRNTPNVGTKTADLLFDHIENELKGRICHIEDLIKYQLLLSIEIFNDLKEKLLESNETLLESNEKLLESKEIISNEDCLSDISNSDIDMISINIQNDCKKQDYLNFPPSSSRLTESAKFDDCIPSTKNKAKDLPPIKKRNVSISRKYVPGYRTGAYAILKGLWLEDGISKHKIIHIAKNYSNTEFDLTSRNSAWSGMKTLIDKGLVYKETGSKKYFITLEGQDIANKLFIDTSILQNDDTNVTLLIDSREIKNRSYRSFFQNYFEGRNVTHDTRSLEVGDFAWIKNEMLCNFIIERKCGSDFVSSITDGRFKEQKNRLLDTGITNIYYLIENLRISDFKSINSDFGFYCLTSTKLEGLTVLETDEIKETASVIEQVHERVKSENLNDMGDYKMSYGSFIEKGSKNKNMDINNMLFYCFAAIYGINNEKACALTSHFKTLNNFYLSALTNKLPSELKDQKFGLSRKNIDDVIKFMYTLQ